MDNLAFQPGLVSGGLLSQEEYLARKQQCTQEALESLQNSAEYKRWQRERQRRGASLLGARTVVALAAAGLVLLLSTAAAAYSFWPRSSTAFSVSDAARDAVQLPAFPPPPQQPPLEDQVPLSQAAAKLLPAPEVQASTARGLGDAPAADPGAAEASLDETTLADAAAEPQQQQGGQEEGLQQALAEQAARAAALEQQLGELQVVQQAEQEQRVKLFHRVRAAEAAVTQLQSAKDALQASNKMLKSQQAVLQANNEKLQAQNVELWAAAAAALEPKPAEAELEGSCPNEAAPAVLGALPELYMLYSAGTFVLLALVGAWRLHVRRVAAAAAQATTAAAAAAAAGAGRQPARQAAKLQRELEAARAEAAAALARAKQEKEDLAGQLATARAEASAKAADAEQAHQALVQVQSELEEQLRVTKEKAAQTAASAAEAQSQLGQQQDWATAAQELAAFTAAALSATAARACAAKGAASGTSSPRSVSPSKRRSSSPSKRMPFAARSRNTGDENAPAVPSPLGPAAGGSSLTAAAAAALAAKAQGSDPSTPRGWLELLQARFGALGDAAAAAERAALDADAAADAGRKEATWHQHKVSELVTDIELLKERLADTKKHFQTAAAGEATAREAGAALQARVEELEAAAAAACGEQERLAAALAAAEAEKQQMHGLVDAAAQQVEASQRVLAEAQHASSGNQERIRLLGEALAAKEAEAAELAEAVEELEREIASLEAQADQVTESLMHTQQQKAQLEKKAADLEQELGSLTLLVEKLEDDKSVLEEQLGEARRTQAALCKAGKQLAAAESTIRESTLQSMTTRSETPDTESDLRRAISEKVAALDLLASAEKRMLEREAADDLAPLPMNSPLRPASRASHLSGCASGDTTPRTRGAKIVNYFSSKLDRVAKLMSGDAEGAGSVSGTPRSHASAASSAPLSGPHAAAGGVGLAAALGGQQRVSGTMNAWLDRLNHSFNTVGQVLHQDLAGMESPRPEGMEAPCQAGVDRTQEALDYSAAEVAEILKAMDAAKSMEGHGPAVAATRDELAAAHGAVAAAMREVQACSVAAGQRRKARRDLLQEVQRLSGQIEFASETVDTELERKVAAEDRVAGAQERLAAAEVELEAAQQRRAQVDAAFEEQQGEGAGSEDEGEGVDSELWEERLRAHAEYERCVAAQRVALDEMQSALSGKRDAIERVAAAAGRLEAAEVAHEEAAEALDQAQADLGALAAQHLQLADALAAAQQRQAAALTAAVAALDRCLSPEEGDAEASAALEDGGCAAEGSVSGEAGGVEEEDEEASAAGPAHIDSVALAAALLPAFSPAAGAAAFGSPSASEDVLGVKTHLTVRTSSGCIAEVLKSAAAAEQPLCSPVERVRSPAEVAADLLDESWWRTPRSM